MSASARAIASTLREIAEFVPGAAGAKLVHSDVHRIPMGIACPKPGTELKRPVSATRMPRLFLAAEAILSASARPRSLALAPRPTEGLAGLVRAATRLARGSGPLLA